VGGLAAARAPSWRGLPALVIGFSVAYTWGNGWACHALGLADSAVHALAFVTCIITGATFLPLEFGGRVGLLVLQALGHLVAAVKVNVGYLAGSDDRGERLTPAPAPPRTWRRGRSAARRGSSPCRRWASRSR
jgi:hypothetical protein